MKVIEMEQSIQELVKQIYDTELVPKCIEVAHHMGKDRFANDESEWATANYIFEKDNVKVDFFIYAMGDQEIKVDYKGKRVFEVKEMVNSYPEYPNPIVRVKRELSDVPKRFEVRSYKPGEWEELVQEMYHKIITDVPKEQLEDVRSRFKLATSKEQK